MTQLMEMQLIIQILHSKHSAIEVHCNALQKVQPINQINTYNAIQHTEI